MVGIIGALAAAVPGFIDLLYYKGGAPPVKKIALMHMTINLCVVVLYAVNIGLRIHAVSGWLCGRMVLVYGVVVEGRE